MWASVSNLKKKQRVKVSYSIVELPGMSHYIPGIPYKISPPEGSRTAATCVLYCNYSFALFVLPFFFVVLLSFYL